MQKPQRKRGRITKYAGSAAIAYLLLFGCMNLLFAWPWNEIEPIGGQALTSINPMHKGMSSLYILEDDAGEPMGWESHNYHTIPLANALINMSETETAVLSQIYGFDSFTSQVANQLANDGVQFIELTKRRIDVNRQFVSQTRSMIIRTDDGDYWLSDNSLEDDALYWFKPLPLLSSDVTSQPQADVPFGSNSGLSVESITVESIDPITLYKKLFDQCVSHTIQFRADFVETTRIFCDEAGIVSFESISNGALVEKATLISSSEIGVLDAASLPGAHQSLDATPPLLPRILELDDIINSELRYISTFQEAVGSPEASIPPRYIPAEQPLIIGSQVNGRLHTISPDNRERIWFFSTTGTVFGQPVVDRLLGHIYFGSSDKHLYAIDFNGIFLWRFETQDNVVTPPLLIEDQLIFGSEDGNIYCLNRRSGTLLRSVSTNGPVTATPALIQDLAIFGSDDGGVYAIDVNRCQIRWIFDAGDAVEAGITTTHDAIIVVGRSLISSLDIETGQPNWSIEPQEIHREKPAILNGKIYLIDVFNDLRVYSAENGRLLWQDGERKYQGSPIVTRNHLLINGAQTEVYLLDESGNLVQEWDIEGAHPNFGDARLQFSVYNSVLGDDGIFWVIDNQSRLYLIGN